MATEKDAQIFVSGVTQYWGSSGKFGVEDMRRIAQEAYDTFCAVFGSPTVETASTPRPSPGASQGPQKPDWKAGVAQVAAGGVQPETKPFSMWGGDKAYIYPQNDKLWADWLSEAKEGNAAAAAAIEKAAKADPGEATGKWYNANCRRIARARACLDMLGP